MSMTKHTPGPWEYIECLGVGTVNTCEGAAEQTWICTMPSNSVRAANVAPDSKGP